MALNKNEIFIASRFEEFKELRSLLRDSINNHEFMIAIDLNNNQASHRSPLVESLFYVRKSEIMVLLVGETYGTIPDDESYSYTHLEYKEAVQDNSNTRVLVFCIGQSYEGNAIKYSDDNKMKSWQKELEKNHRLKKFSGKEDLKYIAEQIFIDVLTSLYDLNNTKFSDNDAKAEEKFTIEDIDNDDDFLQDQEVDFLDTKNSEILGIDLIDENEEDIEGFELLKIPNKLAAMEQKKEAHYAIEINDYATAIKHLKNALDLKPLDFESNYWLAKLYITTAKKSLFYSIEEFLLRAAKIAEKNNNHFKASHCYQLIVQASIFSDREEEGLKYINLAQELTPNFSRLYYEKTKFMLHFNHLKQAKQALIETLNIKMESIELIENDPFFKRYESFLHEVLQQEKETLIRTCYAILSKTNQLRELFSMKVIKIELNNNTLTELWKKSRNGVFMQYNLVSSKINNTNESQLEELDWEMEDLENKYKSDKNNEKEKKDLLVNEADRSYESSVKDISKKLKKFIEDKEKKFEDDYIEIKKSMKQKKENIKTWSYTLLIISLGLFFILKNHEPYNHFAVFSPIVIALLVYFYIRKKRKYENQEQNERSELDQIIASEKNKYALNQEELIKALDKELNRIEEEYSTQLKILEESFINDKTDINVRIGNLQQEYQNIKTALESFETEVVTLSKSKFIPFKSLKNALYNSIIRVTPSSYKNYIDNGGELEIYEDFPEYLNIDNIDPERSSFLAKVVRKKSKDIKLSRARAYYE